MPSSVHAVSCGALGFPTQCHGLFVPTFTRESVGLIRGAQYPCEQDHPAGAARASSHAGIASPRRRAQQQKRVDFLTGYCGLSPPTPIQRIGTMAADGQPLPTGFHATYLRRDARPGRVWRPKLAQHAGKPSSSPVNPAKTTPRELVPSAEAERRSRTTEGGTNEHARPHERCEQ